MIVTQLLCAERDQAAGERDQAAGVSCHDTGRSEGCDYFRAYLSDNENSP